MLPMSKSRFSPLKLASSAVGALLVVYIGLIAVVMSYASLTIEYAESMKQVKSQVATLETSYLASVSRLTSADYHALGYAAPLSTTYVTGGGGTALR